MQHPVLDLLGPALVPELRTDITASPARYKHLVLIHIAAVRTFPLKLPGLVLLDQDLAVITAAFTVIALRIQLCVHDIVVNKLHDA